MRTPRRLTSLALLVASTAAVPAVALGQSWQRATYPKGANSMAPVLAVASNGAASVVFPGPRKAIRVISRARAGAP
ncbi:MAG: hypothetical protein ACKORG_00110 [Actinomycetota bacterium]